MDATWYVSKYYVLREPRYISTEADRCVLNVERSVRERHNDRFLARIIEWWAHCHGPMRRKNVWRRFVNSCNTDTVHVAGMSEHQSVNRYNSLAAVKRAGKKLEENTFTAVCRNWFPTC